MGIFPILGKEFKVYNVGQDYGAALTYLAHITLCKLTALAQAQIYKPDNYYGNSRIILICICVYIKWSLR